MENKNLKVAAADLITILLTYVPIIFSITTTYFILTFIINIILKITLLPILIQLNFILAIFIVRICLPKLKAGVYLVGNNKKFLTWYAHSMLTRSARCFGIHYLIHSTSIFRWLYWLALGAKIPYDMSTSYKITIHDAPLISIGKNTILAEDVEISAHLLRGDKILIAPVTIGSNVFIGRDSYIGPRTKIANNAWIGMKNSLSSATISENETIDSYSWHNGNPKKDK